MVLRRLDRAESPEQTAPEPDFVPEWWADDNNNNDFQDSDDGSQNQSECSVDDDNSELPQETLRGSAWALLSFSCHIVAVPLLVVIVLTHAVLPPTR